MFFYEIVQHNKYNRNNLKMCEYFDFHDRFGEMDIEEYSSVYAYTSTMYDYVQESGGIKGYKNEVATPYLHWDVDEDDDSKSFEENVHTALESTRILYKRLLENFQVPLSNLKVFFSGSKGFHVYYFSPNLIQYGASEKIPFIVKNVCLGIAKDINVDDKVYNHTRIMRTPNSQHGSTGLFKVDITDIFLNCSVEDIIMRAEDQHRSSWDTIDYDSDSESLLDYLIQIESEYEIKKSNTGSVESSELLELFKSGVRQGERNEMLTRIAGVLHQHHDYEWLHAMLHMINNQSVLPLPENEVNVIAESVNSYPVNRPIKQVSIDKVYTIKSSASRWYDIMAQNGFLSFGPRYKHITKEMNTSIPGDVIGVVGGSGVGKTVIGLDLLNELSIAMDCRCAFFSVEMNVEGVFFRIAIMESEHLADDVGYIRPKDVARELHSPSSQLVDGVFMNWERLLFVDDVTSIIEIEEYVVLIKKELSECGIRMGGIGIDYGQLIDGADDKNGSALARSLPPLAKRLETRIFILLQLNKGVVGKYEEPIQRHIEGSGGWFQAMTHCLMVWKNANHQNVLNAKWEKTRWGIPDGNHFCFMKNGLKLTSIDMIDEDPLA